MEVNKTTLRQFRTEFDGLIKPFAKEKGIQMSMGSISFDKNSFYFKVNVISAKNKGQAEKIEFEKYASSYGLKGKYGEEIELYNQKYKLVAIKPKASKYPIVAIRLGDGKRVKIPFDKYVREKLGVKW